MTKHCYARAMAGDGPGLTQAQLQAYLAFTEVGGVLRHAVERQLREAGDLSYAQFHALARLGDSPNGCERMTDLADGVVYSRSGFTHQAQLLEQRGLVERTPSAEDERSTVVTITQAGRDILAAVLPGHMEVVRAMLFAALSRDDEQRLADILPRAAAHLRSLPPRSAAPRRRRR